MPRDNIALTVVLRIKEHLYGCKFGLIKQIIHLFLI
jgi:hypothetical protein